MSHHWCLVVGIHFLIMSVQQVFLVPYFFFTLQSYLASAFFASIFSSSLQRWPSHDNLLLFTILLPFSTPVFSCNYLFLKFFGHLTPMTSWSSSHWKESIISEMVLLVVHNYLLHWKMLLDISFGKERFSFVLMVTVRNLSRGSSIFMVLVVEPFLWLLSDSLSIRDPRHLRFFHKSFSSGILNYSLFDSFSVRFPVFSRSEK